ncbi:restriction endonuclease subunit S [Marinilabilia rubra]|uniref:Restriction endonuclease subunit S n=1 Tax=Marinilabilia rubra TaxID=2162893 RepID=A0A2U2BBU0_9BACT|nr:restriction endonuclease subunit S [Marinilabilia rubra]PWE00493.1 restriction endonuclease subunit S [Marinilabilia rubra]
MKLVSLTDICRPKQWKTISMKDFTEKGYSVYGANGKIGWYSEFNHKEETLLITCRGASCGSVNISEPYSYINGNAMALDSLSKDVYIKYLYYYLKNTSLKDCISGSAQPQITKLGLDRVQIPLPPLPEQKRIATILDKADALRQKSKQQLAAYEELLQATFLDMFGDPVTNPKGWEEVNLGGVIDGIESGWSPKCESSPRKGNNTWAILTLSAVSERNYLDNKNKKLPDSLSPKENIEVKPNDLLFSRKNTRELVGACAYVFKTPPKLLLPDTIFRIKYQPLLLNGIFTSFLFNDRNFRRKIQKLATGSAGSMPNISKEKLKNLSIPLPPLNLQNHFAQIVQNIEAQKTLLKQSMQENEDLFNALVQKAFKGEL